MVLELFARVNKHSLSRGAPEGFENSSSAHSAVWGVVLHRRLEVFNAG